MPTRLVLVVLTALSLAACSGPRGLVATGRVAIRGTSPAGPFDGIFGFPSETRLDGSAGTTAMCTISRGTGSGGTAVYGAVVDLIAPSGSGPVETVTIMARSGETSGTLEADVRGAHYSNASCAYSMSYVGPEGSLHVRGSGDCTLDAADGSSVTAEVDLILQGCTVIDG